MQNYFKEIKKCLSMLKYNFTQTMIFELIFNAISLGTIYLLNKLIFSFTLKVNHIEYLSNATFWTWLRSPITIIVIFISFFIWLFISIIEVSAMIRNYNSKFKINCFQMFQYGIEDAKKIFNEKSTRLIWYIVVIIPAMGAIGAFNFNISVFFPEYIYSFINSHLILLILMIIGFIILYIYSNKWIYTLFYFQLKNTNIKDAIASTNKKMKAELIHTLIGKLILTIAVLLIIIAINLVIFFFIIMFIRLFMNNESGYELSLNICYWIPKIILYFSQLLIIPISISYITVIFKNNNHFTTKLNYQDYFLKPSKKIKRLGILTIALALIVNILIIYKTGITTYTNLKSATNIPSITAHRGSSITEPENTILAFDEALQDGADWLELDVHETKDGVLVITHDANLKRTAGVKKYVYNLTFAELKEIKVKGIYSNGYIETTIPTLEEVLKRYQGKAKLNIELKPTQYDTDYVDKVISLIKEYNFESDCMVASMNESILEEVKSKDQNITVLYNMAVAEGNVTKLTSIDNYSVEQSYITESLIQNVHNNNKLIFAWTVNDPDTIRKLAALGVDSIVTDDPLLARSVLERNRLEERFFFLKYIFKTS